MTDQQAMDFLRHIEAPVYSLMATPSAPWASKEKTAARLEVMRHGRHETIEGHHHFHMDAPEQIAPAIQSFIVEHEHAAGDDGRGDRPT
jgi:pimeloyl-ACP methyl ester carboxylesterase